MAPFVTHYDGRAGLASFTGSISSLILLSWGFIHAAGTVSCHIDQTSQTQGFQCKEITGTRSYSFYSFLPASFIPHLTCRRNTMLAEKTSSLRLHHLRKHMLSCTDRVNTGIFRAAPLTAITMTVQKCGKLKTRTDFVIVGLDF